MIKSFSINKIPKSSPSCRFSLMAGYLLPVFCFVCLTLCLILSGVSSSESQLSVSDIMTYTDYSQSMIFKSEALLWNTFSIHLSVLRFEFSSNATQKLSAKKPLNVIFSFKIITKVLNFHQLQGHFRERSWRDILAKKEFLINFSKTRSLSQK